MEKVDLIVRGDYVVPMDDDCSVITDGAVAVKGAKIAGIGTYDSIAARFSSESIISGEGRVVLPGFINTHTHAAMVFMRGMADDLPLKVWLEEHIWPAEDRWLGPEYINDAVELAVAEMLKAGVTTFNDMYFFENVAAEVSKRLGMRAMLGAGIIDFPTKTTTGADDCLQKAEFFIEKWNEDELIYPAVAPHAVYSCSTETLRKSKALADKYGVHIHTHISETEWEAGEVVKKYGKTSVTFLEEEGFLSENVIAAHCVWVTDEEIEILAKRKVGVAHCVESNLKLASGIAPVTKMIRAGVSVGLGTDGAASNNDLNILGEMSTAAKLHKAITGDPTALNACEALKMATRWGAEAMGMGSLIGSLEEGKAADIITIDTRKPHLSPQYNVFSHMAYAARASDVDTVVVNGRIVVSGGKLLSADEEQILRKARKWGEKINEIECNRSDSR
jgi:5-methylthioadenosine/S-adenosylhomocysteine deaminase